jgi:hypothetical protein
VTQEKVQIDGRVRVRVLAAQKQSFDNDSQVSFFLAFTNGTGFCRFIGNAFSTRKLGIPGQWAIRSASANQVASGVLDDGNADALRG